MIFYDEEVTLRGAPEGTTARLVGTYDPKSHPSVTVEVHLSTGGVQRLYSHHPSSMVYEEPNSDEVLAKYLPRVTKARGRVEKSSYEQLFGMASLKPKWKDGV
jgi:hypothetical protein